MNKILFVDDEEQVLSGMRRMLHGVRNNWELTFASSGEQALEELEKAQHAVIVSDMRMPGMDGAQLLSEVRLRMPDVVPIMLTGNSDLATAVRAVNEGRVFRFLTKPCDPEHLTNAVEAGLEQYRLVHAERELLEGTVNGCVKVMTEILSLVDPDTYQHSNEMRGLATEVAEKLGMSHVWELQLAVMLAQLGRITIPPELLVRERDGSLMSKDEREMLARIPSAGGDLLEHIPRLQGVARIVRLQAVDYDPNAKDEVPVGARILRVLQDMIKMEESGLDRVSAVASMNGERPTHDPSVIAAVASCLGIGTSERGMHIIQIAFDALQPGNVLAAPLMTLDGRLILREGLRIGHINMERLRIHQRMSGLREPIHIQIALDEGQQLAREAS